MPIINFIGWLGASLALRALLIPAGLVLMVWTVPWVRFWAQSRSGCYYHLKTSTDLNVSLWQLRIIPNKKRYSLGL
ncbi:hypothetical protein VCR4J5_1330001 [Vibrio crassostreae]|uniref:Uncharacterized protein n=1 Tax=Vibrio crassostreae TaxID=246167 RepID=A0ABM9QN68_9VIBR|nr:hypothetical protein VCR4J5_1330001 [Vibrio crassostreae]CDT52126.1 hypothetical protein VCRLGP8_40010 [Vibrio crassostreae]